MLGPEYITWIQERLLFHQGYCGGGGGEVCDPLSMEPTVAASSLLLMLTAVCPGLVPVLGPKGVLSFYFHRELRILCTMIHPWNNQPGITLSPFACTCTFCRMSLIPELISSAVIFHPGRCPCTKSSPFCIVWCGFCAVPPLGSVACSFSSSSTVAVSSQTLAGRLWNGRFHRQCDAPLPKPFVSARFALHHYYLFCKHSNAICSRTVLFHLCLYLALCVLTI